MRKLFVLFGLSLATPVWAVDAQSLLGALRIVESGQVQDGHVPRGDHGKARGPLQIHQKYWQDSQYYGSPALGLTWADCERSGPSELVVRAVWHRYDPGISLNIDLSMGDLRILALRHHYGGGSDRRSDPDRYWPRVLKVIKH